MSDADVSQTVAQCRKSVGCDSCRRCVAGCRAMLQIDARDGCRKAVAGCHGCIATQRLRQQHTLKGVCAVVAGGGVYRVGSVEIGECNVAYHVVCSRYRRPFRNLRHSGESWNPGGLKWSMVAIESALFSATPRERERLEAVRGGIRFLVRCG